MTFFFFGTAIKPKNQLFAQFYQVLQPWVGKGIQWSSPRSSSIPPDPELCRGVLFPGYKDSGGIPAPSSHVAVRNKPETEAGRAVADSSSNRDQGILTDAVIRLLSAVCTLNILSPVLIGSLLQPLPHSVSPLPRPCLCLSILLILF